MHYFGLSPGKKDLNGWWGGWWTKFPIYTYGSGIFGLACGQFKTLGFLDCLSPTLQWVQLFPQVKFPKLALFYEQMTMLDPIAFFADLNIWMIRSTMLFNKKSQGFVIFHKVFYCFHFTRFNCYTVIYVMYFITLAFVLPLCKNILNKYILKFSLYNIYRLL